MSKTFGLVGFNIQVSLSHPCLCAQVETKQSKKRKENDAEAPVPAAKESKKQATLDKVSQLRVFMSRSSTSCLSYIPMIGL